ncbi:hypothetical protein NEF87_001720 [Candidatus Lokiarchaeum ossiferum]|uniref:Uncharacterized protein n=1 Tax=Candidatus Lokiarchaeum ossiferum TaxID=2951803 RepID=A0ABY6HPI7_9ARCH|nr:hypothetical protein NEF87_001720 [Candidatus Lokiarchaeum sp. B-35]
MAEIPTDDTNNSPEQQTNDAFSLVFRKPIDSKIAEQLISDLLIEDLPRYQIKHPTMTINPIYHANGDLLAIDFGIPLTKALKRQIGEVIKLKYYKITGIDPSTEKERPMTFTDLLGTYRIKLTRIYIPILICIGISTFLAWLTSFPADVEINGATFPDENNAAEILLNGLIPVILSAVFITVLWLLIKKFGIIVFKVIMGILVVFYTWYGILFFATILGGVLQKSLPVNLGLVIYIAYLVIIIGSAIVLLIMGYLFFKNRLGVKQKNILVLLYGIFMGGLIGLYFPMWTTFSFAIFLSIWDLITVFKGPLGKIAGMLQEGQAQAKENLDNQVARGEYTKEEAQEISQFSSLQNQDIPDEELKDHYKEMEIELGSGDLILYSALVANVFVNTLKATESLFHTWISTIFVIVGVLSGAALTIYLLITKRRMLPALPFSMFFGIAMFFISKLFLLLF